MKDKEFKSRNKDINFSKPQKADTVLGRHNRPEEHENRIYIHQRKTVCISSGRRSRNSLLRLPKQKRIFLKILILYNKSWHSNLKDFLI